MYIFQTFTDFNLLSRKYKIDKQSKKMLKSGKNYPEPRFPIEIVLHDLWERMSGSQISSQLVAAYFIWI